MNSSKNKIVNLIDELHKFSSSIITFNPPVRSEDVLVFEKQFNVLLPNDYKELVQIHNGFELMGDVVLGVFSEENPRNNLNDCYAFEHFDSVSPMPKDLIPFSPDGYGNYYCFDTKTNSIVFWESECDYSEEAPEVVYKDLYSMIHEIFIDWVLEDYNYDGSNKENTE